MVRIISNTDFKRFCTFILPQSFLKMTFEKGKAALLFHHYLFFIFALADKILALSQHHCGENVSLDRGPAGSINLTSPGRFNDTTAVNNASSQTDEPLPDAVCSWIIDIPPGRTVRLTLLQLERGSAVWVRCVWSKEDHILVSRGTVVLSHCDQNKATLSWREDGGSSNSIQLSYHGRKA